MSTAVLSCLQPAEAGFACVDANSIRRPIDSPSDRFAVRSIRRPIYSLIYSPSDLFALRLIRPPIDSPSDRFAVRSIRRPIYSPSDRFAV